MWSKYPFDISRNKCESGQMDASGLQSTDCLIFEIQVSVKDPYSDTKVKTLLEKSYIWNSNTKGSHLLGANVSFELLDIPTSTVLSDAFCSKAITVEHGTQRALLE